MSAIITEILKNRGLVGDAEIKNFLSPQYEIGDPFLLPDMKKAVVRIAKAIKNGEKILIYGDYDIDGIASTTILKEALETIGAHQVTCYIPDRFSEGYGLNTSAVEKIAKQKVNLVVTVDCGSLSHAEIDLANKLGIDVVITDHHAVAPEQPKAVAVINPHRPHNKYPFREFAGVGVVFKLVQALQAEFPKELKTGQEKWLLDLVALGTVCDIVPLVGENRSLAYWGLKVLKKTRRAGLKALAATAGVDIKKTTARDLGFGFGPRLNAAGRLQTAKAALELLQVQDPARAFALAGELDSLNTKRRSTQDKIFEQAEKKVFTDPVIVVSGQNWSHGIIGIVASKLVEKFHRPVFIFEELPDGKLKGSARTFGDFSIVAAIDHVRNLITSGGGHAAAGGITMDVKNLPRLRAALQKYHASLDLKDQDKFLSPSPDASISDFQDINPNLIKEITQLEPFGRGNEPPVLLTRAVKVIERKTMGANCQHVKFRLKDSRGKAMSMFAFGAANEFTAAPSDRLHDVYFEPTLNTWQGRSTVEGKLVKIC